MQEIIAVINETTDFILEYNYSGILFWFKVLAFNASIYFVLVIIYSITKILKIYKKMHRFDIPEPSIEVKPQNIEEWSRIMSRGKLEDEGERKFSIIAADSLVERILTMAGYRGENLGEILKSIKPEQLSTLDDIWEAHKVRNRIAHEADFRLSKEETLKALSRFEKSLRELGFI